MCGHAERQAGERLESGEIGRFQGGAVGIDHRQLVMAVGVGAAVAGQMLEHGQNAAGHEPLRDRAGDGRHFARLHAVGPIANHSVAPGHGDVRQRQAIDVDADRGKIGGDQVAGQPRRRDPGRRFAVIKLAVAGAGRIDRPLRRPEALDTAAFLVHQHGRLPANGVAK